MSVADGVEIGNKQMKEFYATFYATFMEHLCDFMNFICKLEEYYPPP